MAKKVRAERNEDTSMPRVAVMPMNWIPKKLSRDEKDTLEGMRGSKSFTVDLSREDKALFDKQKEIF